MMTNAFWLFLIWIMTACTSFGGPLGSEDLSPKPSEQLHEDQAISGQLQWIVSVFNEHGGQTSKDAILAHFHPTFLAQISADQMLGIFNQLAIQFGTFQLNTVDPTRSPSPGVQMQIAHTSTKAGKMRIVLTIDVPSGTINGLLFQPDDSPIGRVPESLKEADLMLQTITPESGLLIAEVKNESCQPLHQMQSSQPHAIGSAFKLYVLLALIDEVRQKKISWEDMMEIQDRWKTLPSGTMQNEPAGTKFSVQKFAEQMIAISDNTATDHLLYELGRDRVQAAVIRSQHHKPGLNIPFLSARELFFLKFKKLEAETWLKLNPTQKEKYLDTKVSSSPLKVSEEELLAWTEPRFIDTIEWFASGEDICRAMASFLRVQEKDKGTALAILGKNPGLPFDRKRFPYVGFKGGSEPGVFSGNWLLQREDKRWFVVSLTANDREKDLKQNELLGIATGVLQKVGELP